MSVGGVEDVLTLGLVSSAPVANFKGNIFTGNANLGNLAVANFFSGNGNALFNVQGGNVVGTVANATHACTANTVTNAAQSNITSLGTLTSLTVGATVNPSLGNNATASFFTGTLTTAAQPNVTSLGRLTGLTIGNASANTVFGNGTITANGNIQGSNIIASGTSNAFYGNAYGLADIPGANVTGTVALAETATVAGTVTTAAQPNITSTGTLTGLNVSGATQLASTTIAGNLTVTGTTITANATSLVVRDPMIEMGGNLAGGALTTNDGKDRGTLLKYFTTSPVDAFMGWDNSNAEFAFGSNVSVTNDVVTFNNLGNIRANFFIGNGSQLTGLTPPNRIFNANSNVAILNADANVTISANNVANIVQVFGNQGGTTGNGMSVAGNIDIGLNWFKGNGALITGLSPNTIFNGTSNVSVSSSGGNVTMGVGGVANVLQINSAGNLEIKGTLKTGGGSGGAISGVDVLTANTVTATLANGTSNIRMTNNGNVTVSANAISNIVTITGGSSNGANVSGYVSATGQLISTVATGTAPLQVTSTTRVANLNVNYANVSDFEAVTIATTGTYYPTFINGITTGNYAAFANASLSFNAATGALTASSFVGSATGPLANGTSNVSIAASGGNVTISAGGTANVLTVTSTGILGTFVNSSDIITNYAVASISHDFNTASVLYVSGITGTPTFAFTNVPTTNNRAIVIPVIIAQGGTAITYPTSISINGVTGQTINYIQGTTPTGRANKTEVLGLTLIRTNAGAWVVLASVSSYG